MKKTRIKKIIIAASTLLLFSLSAEASTCKDDPRMYTIKSVIDQIDAGEDVKPMKLTPKTFLELTSTVRAKLGDNIRVFNESCVPTQIFQGKIAKPLYMPFPVIEQALHRAGLRKDFTTMNVIFQQFRASELPASRLVYMARPLLWTPDAVESLYDAGIMAKSGRSGTVSTQCQSIQSPALQIELFATLGGQVEIHETLIFSFYGREGYAHFSLPDGKGLTSHTTRHKNGSEVIECGEFDWLRATSAYSTSGMSVYTSKYSGKERAVEEYVKMIANGGY
jgi:hypothetical protein